MHIFISYAKADTIDLASKLRVALEALPNVTAWMDEELEPGESWATQIQQEIDRADFVLVLLSPDVNRPVTGKPGRSFVLREIDYARAAGKPIIPIMAQETFLPVQLAGDQYIDFTTDQSTGMKRLIRKIASMTGIPLSDVPATTGTGIKIVDPTAIQGTAKPAEIVYPRTRRPVYRRPMFFVILLLLAVIAAFAVLALNPNSTVQPTAAVIVPSNSPQNTQSTFTDTPTNVPTDNSTSTPMPTLEIVFVVQTLDAKATSELATSNAASTALLRATGYAVGTRSLLDQTATATLWTATLTPNITASIEAYRTQQVDTATAQFLMGQTVTATLWTATPTSTPTVTLTLTSTVTPTPMPLGFAGNPVLHNVDWKIVYQTFDGIEMALVPAGCFMMGSSNGAKDERPINKQCFEKPFWVDRYEITNKQYGSVGHFQGDNRPRDSVTWFSAYDFCAKHSSRLPNEREWEYAARGPDNLVYPWGNDFVDSNAVYAYNAKNQTAMVGSRPAGDSWVGASDLNGNVREWVNSIYGINKDQDPLITGVGELFAYPYDTTDGRDDYSDSNAVVRGYRGASFLQAKSIPSSYRDANHPKYLDIDLGFRCVRDY